MTERVALYLQDSHDLRDGLEYAKYAEEKGFEAVWQAESRLVRDAIVPMAAYAAVTNKIKVGSGVINNWTRNIGLLAATFLTLDDLAPNRIICGIGAWWDPLAKNVGIDRRKPLLAMRETVEVMRRLLNMERVTFHGEFHHVDGIELDVVHGRREPRNVPIMIGATGDLMMEMTGEIADGCVLNYCVAPEYNNKALELLEKGAKSSEMKQNVIARIINEAYQQGGILSMRDIGLMLVTHSTNISKERIRYEKKKRIVLPHTGVLHDMGSSITHKYQIVYKYVIEKKDPVKIAWETNHSPAAVDRYLKDFNRVKTLIYENKNIDYINLVTNIAKPVIKQYQQLIDNYVK